MTNHWIDIKNSDCIMIMGGNAAENHPMSFKWVTKAKEERDAKLICVDPRFTRSASKADIYAPLRSGTDIAFIMGMINYVIENKLYHQEYVKEYTNATLLVKPEFSFKDGLFSGYDEATRKYNQDLWGYQTEDQTFTEVDKKTKKETKYQAKVPKRDMTISDPNCVFQLLKKHASRYTPEMVVKITGCPKDKFLKVAKAYAKTGDPKKVGTVLYAMGWTQHTVGTQNIRAFSMLQLLLGNIGRPGGGVNALRGEPNVQGSTDHGLLFHLLTGYLNAPDAQKNPNFRAYADQYTVDKKVKNVLPGAITWWQHGEKYAVSMLKAFWGDTAQAANSFCFDWLPKVGAGYKKGKYSHIALFEAMYGGDIKGLLVLGQNPAVGGPNSDLEAKALDRLDWLVDLNLWETETTAFWKRPGIDPADIQTEVFSLPAADSVEKEGSISNSGRWIQWRSKGAEPLGKCKSDLEIIDLIAKELKVLYEKEGGPNSDAITKLVWDYGDPASAEEVAKECHGFVWPDRNKLVKNFTELQKDGSTACGNWLFSGTFSLDGKNLMKRRIPEKEGIGNNLEWSFSWPVNRRIIYNRASCDPSGKPWDEERKEIWWDAAKVDETTGKPGMWTGNDIPDFAVAKAPDAPGGTLPAIMKSEGLFGIFAAEAEGPLPEHYEPLESPVDKNPMSSQKNNPAIFLWHKVNSDDKVGNADDFPIVGTTYRVTEHWQTGIMTRNTPWLAELMPEMFVEMSKELAKEKGIENGEWVKVVSARGEVEAVAIVTERFKPFKIDGKTVHQVGFPWCYGYQGYITGGPDRNKNYASNQLTPHVGDANTMIPEYKAFLCDVRKVK